MNLPVCAHFQHIVGMGPQKILQKSHTAVGAAEAVGSQYNHGVPAEGEMWRIPTCGRAPPGAAHHPQCRIEW